MGNKMKPNGCMTFFAFWMALTVLWMFIFEFINKTEVPITEMLFLAAFMGFVTAPIIFLIQMFGKIGKQKKAEREQLLEDKKVGRVRYGSLCHVAGLPAMKHAECTVLLDSKEENVSFLCGGNQYVIPFSRVEWAEVQTNIDEETFMKTSVSSMVARKLFLGDVGMILGSLPKKHTQKKVWNYIVFLYFDKTENRNSILLKSKHANWDTCTELAEAIKSKIQKQTKKIEL